MAEHNSFTRKPSLKHTAFSKDERTKEFIKRKHSRRNRTGSFRTDRPGVQRNVTLTGTGEFIWEHIEETESFSHLVQLILEEYEVDKDTASQDAAGFIMQLLQAGMVRPTGINW